ncbi:MAG: 2-keto-4-pentenoate hydratase [Gammaproteobacteria bacterium]|nr:2-keto-4-pentenoate hydratase [Gammaproteobacteria bacterium]
MPTSLEAERAIGEAFAQARRSAGALQEFPGRVPATLAEGYRIQDHAIAAMQLPIGGWKVGRIPPPLAAQYGAARLAGPVLARSIRQGPRGGSGFVFAGGYAAAEAEFLFELRSPPVAGKRHFTEAEAATLVKSVHVGIEIASSPFRGINDLGPAVTVADFGNNNGLIIGPEIPDWRRSGMLEWPVEVRLDGRPAGNGRGGEMPGGPLASVCFLLEHLAARRLALAPGAWISSGAVTGVHEVRIGERATALFGPDLVAECLIEQARPHEEGLNPAR